MKRHFQIILPAVAIIFFAIINIASSHPADDLNNISSIDIGWVYLKLGFTHIIPYGADHILFVLGLFFLSPQIRPLLWQISAFTIAHSITLALSMFDLITIPSYIVEPVIAFSIVFIAYENITAKELKPFRIAIVFLFGLIHGLGFAGVLKELGLPKDQFVNALISFNIGVELGQISVVMIALITFGYWFRNKSWYRKRIDIPGSIVIGLIAVYWTVQRIFF